MWVSFWAMVLALSLLTRGSQCAVYYFSSVEGNDQLTEPEVGPDKPWRTLSRASEAVARAQPGDEFLFCSGDTWYDEQLTITAKGTPKKPIVFSSYPCQSDNVEGERPIFDGSIPFDGDLKFSPWEVHEEVKVLDLSTFSRLPNNSIVSRIFINNKLYYSPRAPNYTNHDDATGDIGEYIGPFTIVPDERSQEVTVLRSAKLLDLQKADGYWKGSRAVIRNAVATWAIRDVVSHENDTLTVFPPLYSELESVYLYLEGKLSELDSPREAFFDPVSRKLYFFPMPYAAIEQISFVVDKHSSLVNIQPGSTNLLFHRIRINKGRRGFFQNSYLPSLSVSYSSSTVAANKIVIHDCVVENTEEGIVADRPNVDLWVDGNVVGWTIGDGIRLGGGGVNITIAPARGGWSTPAETYRSWVIRASRNRVHDTGYIAGWGWSSGTGIQAPQADDNVVYRTGFTAITGIPSQSYSFTNNTVFSFSLSNPGGSGLYGNGSFLNITHNLVVSGYGNGASFGASDPENRYLSGSYGILMDGPSTQGFLVYNNTVVNVRGIALDHSDAQNGTWKDNFVVNDIGDVFSLSFIDGNARNRVERNTIVTRTNMVVMKLMIQPRRATSSAEFGIADIKDQVSWDGGLVCALDQASFEPAPLAQVFRLTLMRGLSFLMDFPKWEGETGDPSKFCDKDQALSVQEKAETTLRLIANMNDYHELEDKKLDIYRLAARPFGDRKLIVANMNLLQTTKSPRATGRRSGAYNMFSASKGENPVRPRLLRAVLFAILLAGICLVLR
ncbi:hypothetical protein CBR_g51407 [Chara braunii]|uniref:Right handed beta helix domain-containing protein n=1 Tax=Chara braunii TaxID=69332 RepID=A0A388M8V9_CHABU|nr:hypothetical protein CBR_g51407 [Chara braunii]|eukprot:GBG90899.1 hypothetical protein CBR_g51407 [Chara braunii]